MNINELRLIWEAEERAGFSGWNFSHLEGRWQEEPLSWDYRTIIDTYIKPDYKLLDMGTGGGEFLLTINHPYQNTSVTESWEPNFLLCKERLEPQGICVKKVIRDDELPFNNNTFDVIINRHESYDLSEVKRILKSGGIFITQQVGGTNDNDLSSRLIESFTSAFPDFDLEHQINAFQKFGFEILIGREEYPKLRFFDIGAVVYFAKIIPWEFPGFTVDHCFNKLFELNSQLESTGYIETVQHRFVIAAKNNKNSSQSL